MANTPTRTPDPKGAPTTKSDQKGGTNPASKPNQGSDTGKRDYEVDRTQNRRTDTREAEMGNAGATKRNAQPGKPSVDQDEDADAARGRDEDAGRGIDDAVAEGVDGADQDTDSPGPRSPTPM